MLFIWYMSKPYLYIYLVWSLTECDFSVEKTEPQKRFRNFRASQLGPALLGIKKPRDQEAIQTSCISMLTNPLSELWVWGLLCASVCLAFACTLKMCVLQLKCNHITANKMLAIVNIFIKYSHANRQSSLFTHVHCTLYIIHFVNMNN